MLGKFFHLPGSDLADRVPPGQHLARGFPVLTYGKTPEVTTDDWQLRVWGLAEPMTFSWSDIMQMPQTDLTADFHCVTTWSKLDVQWSGVRIVDLMQHIKLDPATTHVLQHCYGDYTTNVSLEDFLRDKNLLAHTLVGEPIPADHGGPMRTLIPHLYAWKSAKWISGLEFLPQQRLGFWERNGYHQRGEPWAEQRYSDS